jgi:hypothetical protein
MTSLAVLPLGALLIVANVVPAAAADAWRLYRHHDSHWHEVHRGIYQLGNRIALLQADPELDPDQKGPVITAARAEIRRLNAQLPAPGWRWDVPCCYRRKPIRLR